MFFNIKTESKLNIKQISQKIYNWEILSDPHTLYIMYAYMRTKNKKSIKCLTIN